MPNTPNHSLPYPDDEEWLSQGAYAIEQLARRVDDVLADDAALVVLRADPNQNAAAGVAVSFPGAVAVATHWAFDGVSFTYTGPGQRTFLIDVEVTINAQGVGPESTVELRSAGGAFAGSHDLVSTAPGDGTVIRRDVTHRVTVPVRFTSGDSVHAFAVGGTVRLSGLRIYPIGAHT